MDEQNKQTPAPYAAGTGSVPVTPDRQAFERMGYRERLALKRENPEVYRDHNLMREKCDALEDARFRQQELFDEWEKLLEEQDSLEESKNS